MQEFTDWAWYAAAFITFFVSHRLPLRPPVKNLIVAGIGARGFTLAYSAMSVAVLIWVIVAAGRAPYVALWPQEIWMGHLTLTLMAFASVIFALAIGRPNPLSFGGSNNDCFDPADPGMVGWMHHPLLVALGLWALAHIIPNGNLAHLLMFGLFASFSLVGMKIIGRRKKRLLGAEEWARLSATRRRFRPSLNGMFRLAAGLVLYLLMLWLHIPVIGVAPLG